MSEKDERKEGPKNSTGLLVEPGELPTLSEVEPGEVEDVFRDGSILLPKTLQVSKELRQILQEIHEEMLLDRQEQEALGEEAKRAFIERGYKFVIEYDPASERWTPQQSREVAVSAFNIAIGGINDKRNYTRVIEHSRGIFRSTKDEEEDARQNGRVFLEKLIQDMQEKGVHQVDLHISIPNTLYHYGEQYDQAYRAACRTLGCDPYSQGAGFTFRADVETMKLALVDSYEDTYEYGETRTNKYRGFMLGLTGAVVKGKNARHQMIPGLPLEFITGVEAVDSPFDELPQGYVARRVQ